jgi:hypothetical protein
MSIASTKQPEMTAQEGNFSALLAVMLRERRIAPARIR